MDFELLSGIYKMDNKFYKVLRALYAPYYYKQEVVLGKRGKFIWAKSKRKTYLGWDVGSILNLYWYCDANEKHVYRSPISMKIALMEKRFKERHYNDSL